MLTINKLRLTGVGSRITIMINPFKHVPPLNSPHMVVAKTKSGCVVFLPVADIRDLLAKTDQVTDYFLRQPKYPLPPKAPV